MIKRIIVSLIILPALTVLILMENPYPFVAVGILSLSIALFELYSMLGKKKIKTFRIIGFIFSLVCYSFLVFRFDFSYYFYTYAAMIIVLFCAVIVSKNADNFPTVFFTAGPVIYLTALGSFGLELKMMENGSYWLFILLLMTWVYDGGAYFVGSAIGKHKLIPELSPGKTIEGCVGGVIINVITAVIIKLTFLKSFGLVSVYDMAILAVLISISGQAGDISASIIKRYTGVKNSSNILPGHGGLMDKIDSAIFNAPVLYLYIKLVL